MPTFIDMSNLTKRSTLTGNEEFQVSATEKVTAQQIADLAPAKGVKQVVVTNFQTNTWTLSDGGSVTFSTDIKVGEIVTFTSAKDATNGPGVALFGYAIKYNSLMASYVGMTQSNKLNGIRRYIHINQPRRMLPPGNSYPMQVLKQLKSLTLQFLDLT